MENKLALIGCILILGYTNLAHSALFIADISGNPQTSQIQRGDIVLPIALFMSLKEGDVLRITAKETTITLLEDDRNTTTPITLNRGNTPYTVTHVSKTKGVWDNVMQWWHESSRPQYATVNAYSRGRKNSSRTQPIKLLGLNTEGINWITLQTQQVYLTWTGGRPPFTVRLFDENNKILEEQRTDQQAAILSSKNLKLAQHYRIAVSCLQQAANTGTAELVDEQQFTIVAEDTLPADIQQLDQLPLSIEIKTRLRLVRLAVLPEWRFQALQVAQSNEMEEIRQKLLTEP